MGAMLTTLKGGALWAALVIILAVIGATTYLASAGDITGTDALTIVTAVLVAVTGVTSAHVAGQTAASAFNTPAPGSGSAPLPSAAPAPGPAIPGQVAAAPAPAMPHGTA